MEADDDLEGYRAYLLRRLLPATQAFYAGGQGLGEGELLPAHRVMALLSGRTTGDLEARLAMFYDALVQVMLQEGFRWGSALSLDVIEPQAEYACLVCRSLLH